MAWKQVVPEGQDAVWEPEMGESIEGKLVEKKEGVGPNKSRMYMIEKDGGEIMGVWGTTVLDGRFTTIHVGSTVRVTFKGEITGTAGRTYKGYDVDIWTE